MGGNVSKTGKYGSLAATTVAVAGLTTIGTAINTLNVDRIFVRISNKDASAVVFDAFEIQVSADMSNYETLFSSSADYTSVSGVLVGASGDLTVLAAAASGWFILDCSAFHSIRIQASANTTQSVGVTGTWSAM